ncbi:sugar ABC transporter ATP-binding protein [Marinitoga sp. 1135]|uniref:carbohydrate ABC transporter permease n=1 Tax=unclassified Marinitoga TaxID=2640159 RepID=UPI000950B676|nr:MULTISPECIES: carbohydrate ABC transporter permease [unclassified Marinitoga]APT76000.1 sugar ABC transporter ATP-binding protein [Marinitoga sp. 1137]NUU95744.1 sugar ABC transporter ATP-binding protein [Marinitoga sp. 1135]
MKIKKLYLIRRLLLILISFIYILPFLWMIGTSLKPDNELLLFPPRIFPQKIEWSNYIKAIEKFPFFLYLKNSILITLGNIIGVVFTAPFVAYGFSKINWKGRSFFFAVMMSTVMLPGAVTMIPVFLIYKHLGWLDTFYPLIVPAFLGGGAMNVFLIRQFFNTIPNEIIEAAKIDGAGDFRIFFSIMLPLSKPVLALIALFTFTGSWNNYMGPLIYITSEDKFPLALGMPMFMSRYGSYWNQSMAAATLTFIPTLIFFFLAQKYLIEGIKLSGMKS